MHDLVIRGGTVVDGTGRARFAADVAIDGEIITEVGRDVGAGRREIDARGLIVTPGFVDIHTHYDGQATWDSEIAPSSWHGVTSIVMGNCGVGFAPAKRDKHDFLIALMEGVEDIPGTALHEGLPWNWETIPEYLDAVDGRPHAVDLGSQVPHAALRAYVMGDRGADNEQDPTPEEINEMARLTRQALEAGAIGFGTSRTVNHRSRTGQKIGTLTAKTEELVGIAHALRDAQRGVFQIVSDFRTFDDEAELIRRIAFESGRPVSFSVIQDDRAPDKWRAMIRLADSVTAEGATLRAQVASRPVGLLLGLQATINPFIYCASYLELAELPLAARVARLRQPDVKARILAEYELPRPGFKMAGTAPEHMDKLFRLGDPPNYEPDPEDSLGRVAQRAGRNPIEYTYDLLLENGGRELLYFALANYSERNLDNVREMITSPSTLFGLSDGGAHVGTICDASFATSNVTLWSRDRTRGDKLTLEQVVKGQTADTAQHVGWDDRGILKPGYRADVNVIDFENLQLHRPEMFFDLPAGGKRLLQRADGYRWTIKSGQVTFENGRSTGVFPGRLVRGAQPAPVAV